MSNKNKIIIAIICAVIVGGGLGFWGGTVYGRSGSGANRNFAALGANGQRPGGQGFSGRQGANGATGAGGQVRAGGANGGFITGQILTKDAGSITVKLDNGSSKIVLLSGATQIMKTTTASSSDLTVGEQVTVTGAPNTDGSVTANSIQMRQK